MSNTNSRNTKLFLIGLSIIWLTIFSFNFSHLGELNDPEYIFPQGDNQYYIYNLEIDEYERIVEFKSSFFFGSTFFQYNKANFVGIMEQLEVDYGFQINFKYFNVEKPLELFNVKIADIDIGFNKSVNIQGLSTRIENQSLVFSTIWREYDSVFSQINYIYEFDLSGTLIQKKPIVSSYEYATPHDIVSLPNGSYIMIFSLERGDVTSSEGKYIAVVPRSGNITQLITLDDTIRSISFDERQNNYFTISINSNKLKIRDSIGNSIKVITLNRDYSEIDIIDNHEVLLQFYVNPINKFISRAITSVIIILTPILIAIIYSKYKKIEFKNYWII